MILGSILSNMGTGISGVASKTANKTKSGYEKMVQSDGFQVIAGKHEHNAKIDAKYQKMKDEGKKGTGVRSMVHKGWDNFVAADYKDQGAKRAGVFVARQTAGAIATMPLEAGYRYATGTGGLTTKNGERDIAGIPFI